MHKTGSGEELPTGVYFYVITIIDKGEIIKGNISLVR